MDTPRPTWVHWPVYWSAIWVGVMAAICTALMIGLIGIAVGAHEIGPANRILDWHKFHIAALIFSVVGAFIAFVVGGWVTGKIAGILHSEPAILHGAIVWLVAVPLLVVLAASGAGNFFGGWYGGLAGSPAWAGTLERGFTMHATAPSTTSTEDRDAAMRDDARAARNSALGAVTALLLGLVGSVIGGWLASGEPMNFSHYRTRHLTASTSAAAPRQLAANEEVSFRK